MKPFPTDGMQKCLVCGKFYDVKCDWNQGRCPHHPPAFSEHQYRFLNLFRAIKNWIGRK